MIEGGLIIDKIPEDNVVLEFLRVKLAYFFPGMMPIVTARFLMLSMGGLTIQL